MEWEVRVGLEGLEGSKLPKHPKLSKLISFFLELGLGTQTLNSNFSNFFAYFEDKNGIIPSYRWRGESRGVPRGKEHA